MDMSGSKPGTYALVLRNPAGTVARIGRWRSLVLGPGFYIYVGSAFGPGGIRARVSRHYRTAKRKHWHIDYLRDSMSPVSTWCSYEPVKLEHQWAGIISRMPDIRPVLGFGCSDCTCQAHLFATPEAPDFDRFSAAVGGAVEHWTPEPPIP